MNWLALCVLQIISVAAATVASSDQPVFLVSFFPNMTDSNLFFTSCDPGTCLLSYDDGRRRSLAVQLPGNDVVSINLPTSSHIPYGIHQTNKAILINCTVPTSVFAQASWYNHTNVTTDTYAAVAIGPNFIDYVVPTVEGPALTGIAALYSNTEIKITFPCTIYFSGGQILAGDTLNLTLDALDVIAIGIEKSVNCDLGGTRIRSNGPIAVYSKAISKYHKITQILPTVYWGSKFVIPNAAGYSGDYMYRVTAKENDTSVRMESFKSNGNHSSFLTMDMISGYSIDSFQGDKIAIITSNKPVQVTRYVTIDHVYQMGTTIHPTDTYKSNYIISTMDKAGHDFDSYLNVVTSQNCENDIVVNGKSTKRLPLSWTRLQASNFSVGSVAVPAGPVYAGSMSGRCFFSLLIVGLGKFEKEAYAYSAFQSCHNLNHREEIPQSTASSKSAVTVQTTATPFSKFTKISSSQLSKTASTSPTTSQHRSSSIKLSTDLVSNHELLDNSISFTCSREGWLIDVDLDPLKQLYPNMAAGLVYLSEDMCPGQYDPTSHVVRFNVTYQSCKTDVEELKDKIVYKNFLFYPEVSSNIMTAVDWRYDLDCEMKRQESVKITFNPSLKALLHGHGTGQLSLPKTGLKFYVDNLYQIEIIGHPISLNVGSQVYVELSALVEPGHKMVVENCSASPAVTGIIGNPLPAYPLITNKCPAESTTHILSTSRDIFHFSFQALQFRQQHGDIDVSCHIHLCLATDTNPDCTQSCTK